MKPKNGTNTRLHSEALWIDGNVVWRVVASPSKAHLRKALVPSVLFWDGVPEDVSRFMSTLA